MTFLKLLLSSNLICIAAKAIAIPIDKISERTRSHALIDQLSNYVLPIHYNVKLELNDEYLIGEYVITIYITHVTQQINFHMDLMNTNKNMRLILYNNEGNYKISTKDIFKDIVMLKFKNVLLIGMYYLKINIKIPISIVRNSVGSSYINNDGNKEWLITIGVHTRKQQIFPFWNKPELKTTFNISIMHHRKYTILSNIPKQKSELIFNDTRIYYENILISMDNIAFVVSEFQHINLTDAISMWCKSQMIPHVNFALRVIKNVTMYLENYWQNSEGFFKWILVSSEKKVDHVIIPNLQDEDKQILGFVFHREADIMYNEEIDSSERKMIIAPLIARKIIQKYIGNLLDPYRFQWLNEGFIIFQQVYIIDEIVSDFRMMDLFIVQFQHELLDLNTYIDINPVIKCDNYPENYIYSFLSHIKSSIIWRMLERILSPNIFSKGINIYLNIQYTEMGRTSDSLWISIQNVIDELDAEYQFNVRSAVDSWSMQSFSVLKVMRNYLSNVTTISIQFRNKLDEKQYYIPVTYTTESKPNFTITWSNIQWLTSSNPKIEIPLREDQWIILNLQQAGYYRVNYDNENWLKIARYLNSEEYSNIHVLNRAQIIDDAFYFAIKKSIKFSLFWELAIYLQKEKDYIAWYPMIKALEFMSNAFAFSKFYSQFQKIKEPLNAINLFDEDTNDDHVNCLKLELAKWKCIINDTSCTTWANHQLQWHLKNPEENKLLPGWKRWTYCNGLKTANRDTWDEAFKIVDETDHIILECLAYIENNSEIIIDYLERITALYISSNLTHHQSISIKQPETLANIIFLTLARNTKHMLEDVLNILKKIIYRRINQVAAITVIINNVYSEEQLNKIKKFIIKEIEAPVFSNFERKIKTRWSQIKKQTKYLQSVFLD